MHNLQFLMLGIRGLQTRQPTLDYLVIAQSGHLSMSIYLRISIYVDCVFEGGGSMEKFRGRRGMLTTGEWYNLVSNMLLNGTMCETDSDLTVFKARSQSRRN